MSSQNSDSQEGEEDEFSVAELGIPEYKPVAEGCGSSGVMQCEEFNTLVAAVSGLLVSVRV